MNFPIKSLFQTKGISQRISPVESQNRNWDMLLWLSYLAIKKKEIVKGSWPKKGQRVCPRRANYRV